MNPTTDLVYIDQYGLRGSNFYWHKYANHGLTKEDILEAGVVDDRVQVHKDMYLRKGEDGLPALFIGFYEGKEDEESKRYQELQDYLANLMMRHGFRIGTRKEYFHFDYRPDTLPNYKVD